MIKLVEIVEVRIQTKMKLRKCSLLLAGWKSRAINFYVMIISYCVTVNSWVDKVDREDSYNHFNLSSMSPMARSHGDETDDGKIVEFNASTYL